MYADINACINAYATVFITYWENIWLTYFFFILKFLFLLYFALQYCIGFAIHWHESATGVHEFPILNPPSNLPPHIISLGHPSAPAPSILYPVSCIEPRLAIRFLHDNIHVSMPFSQIIPPSPSPTESKSPFYTSMSLLLSHIQGYHYHLSKFHIYGEGSGRGVHVWECM